MAGGLLTSAVVNSGGSVSLLGGDDVGTQLDGGSDYVSSGSTASGTVVNSGGSEYVFSGGVAYGTTVSSGGSLTISSGGVASNTVISSGGTEILQNGATAAGAIDFAGNNATLSIGGTVLPAAVISGFDLNGSTGDAIILSSDSYSSNDSVTLGAGNELSLDINGTISTLQLDPSANYTGHSFYLSSNASDQLVVLDPISWSPSLSLGFLRPAVEAGKGLLQLGTLSNQEIFQQALEPGTLIRSFVKDWGMIENMNTAASIGTISSFHGFAGEDLQIFDHERSNYGILPPHLGAV